MKWNDTKLKFLNKSNTISVFSLMTHPIRAVQRIFLQARSRGWFSFVWRAPSLRVLFPFHLPSFHTLWFVNLYTSCAEISSTNLTRYHRRTASSGGRWRFSKNIYFLGFLFIQVLRSERQEFRLEMIDIMQFLFLIYQPLD